MPMNGSDGTEAYLIANSILNIFDVKTLKKIFPILVSDVDSYIINSFGQKGIVSLSDDETRIFGKNLYKYFEEIDKSMLPKGSEYSLSSRAYMLKPDFKKLFKFDVMDLQKRIANTKDIGNSIFIVRNCLAQSFGSVDTTLILYNLKNAMHKNSILVIGDYDREKLPILLKTLDILNFKEIGKNIFAIKDNKDI